MSEIIKGKCLCGAVRFEASDPTHIAVCHCKMCQNWAGGPFIGVDFKSEIRFTKKDNLKWYDSSAWAKRGFCQNCGASLFYQLKDGSLTAIPAGVLDLPEGCKIKEHIFVDEKPSLYDFADKSPRLTGPEFMARFQENS